MHSQDGESNIRGERAQVDWMVDVDLMSVHGFAVLRGCRGMGFGGWKKVGLQVGSAL